MRRGGSDDLVAFGRLVLVDEGGSRACVAHAGHQLPRARSGGRGEGIARMSEVVEPIGEPGRSASFGP